MPFPLAVFLPALIAWGNRALTAYGLAHLFSEEPVQELKRILFGYVVEYAAKYAGLELDADDPISDASFSHAVSLRVGFPIRTLKDKQMIIEDLDGYMAALVSERSGFTVRSVRDVEVLKQDLQRVALAVVSQRIGIPLGTVGDDGFDIDPQAIREQVLAWAKAQLLAEVQAKVTISAIEIANNPQLAAMVEVINQRLEGSQVSAHAMALQIADKLAVEAVGDFQKVVVGMSKRSRRQESLRAAQAKFRRLHGNRQKYVPLGMAANIG